MDLVSHAIVISRIIDLEAAGARKQEIKRVKERVKFIRERWPTLPLDMPKGLRSIRNHYEHFDTRLDKWASQSTKPLIRDMNVTEENEWDPTIRGMFDIQEHEILRSLRGNLLYFLREFSNIFKNHI
ncbi:hypothetical protein [Priestia megaterium]|uniref:hypothetical protein n=1 Tax=Priestia megaterium TaxID=1404 RepID=UPI0032E46496